MCVSAGKKLYKRQGEVKSCFLLQLFVMSSEESIKKAKSALQKACENGTSQVKRYTLSHSLYTVLLHYVDWLPTSFFFFFLFTWHDRHHHSTPQHDNSFATICSRSGYFLFLPHLDPLSTTIIALFVMATHVLCGDLMYLTGFFRTFWIFLHNLAKSKQHRIFYG